MSVEETGSLELFEGKQQEITRQELVERVSEHVNRILRRNLYELKLTTKYDLLICPIVTADPKAILKSIKSHLPKNIKIKELTAK